MNLDGSLGSVDLDALLARLATPEGLAELELGRARGDGDEKSAPGDRDGDAVRADDVAFGLVDDDDGSVTRGWCRRGGDGGGEGGGGFVVCASDGDAALERVVVRGRTGRRMGRRAGRYESDEGWAREHARGRGRGSRPRSAFVVAPSSARVARPSVGGAGAPRERTPATDPYGRGNTRLRSARRSNAPAPT